MIKETTITDLEKLLKMPEGTLKNAITSAEEVAIELPKVKVFTVEEDDQRVENLKREFKTAGLEIAVKEKRRELGLEFEGKTIDNLLENYKKKVIEEAGINPDKKVLELTRDKEALQANLLKESQKLADFEKAVNRERNQFAIDNTILKQIPDNTLIPKEDVLGLFKTKYQVEKSEQGSLLFKKAGSDEILKSPTTLNPLSAEDVLKDFLMPYIGKPAGGAGAGDSGGASKPGTMEAFMVEMEKKNIGVGSEEFNREMQNRIKEKTLTI